MLPGLAIAVRVSYLPGFVTALKPPHAVQQWHISARSLRECYSGVGGPEASVSAIVVWVAQKPP